MKREEINSLSVMTIVFLVDLIEKDGESDHHRSYAPPEDRRKQKDELKIVPDHFPSSSGWSLANPSQTLAMRERLALTDWISLRSGLVLRIASSTPSTTMI